MYLVDLRGLLLPVEGEMTCWGYLCGRHLLGCRHSMLSGGGPGAQEAAPELPSPATGHHTGAAPGIDLGAHTQEERLRGPGAGGHAGQTGTDVHPRGWVWPAVTPPHARHSCQMGRQRERMEWRVVKQCGLVEESGRPLSTVSVWVMDGHESMMEGGPWLGRSRERNPVASPLSAS